MNTRLPFVKEEDKEEYVNDFYEESKKTKFVKCVSTDENGKRTYSITVDVITGVASKQ